MMSKKLPYKDEMVIRSFGIPDIRAVDEGSFIEGHAAVFEQKTNIGDWFYEIIERGAFNECDFDDVLFTANHNLWEIPLARSRRNNSNSTLQLNVDDRGLYIKANLDVSENAEARSLLSSVKRGDINGMSFIFWVKEERWEGLDTDMPTRHVVKVARVREVSAVNFPAYPGTDITARDQSALENAKRALENVRSTLENEKNEREALRLKANILLKG
ncbi:MAG TPA: HK97 family phage prohead protease [Porphyromonadaceae bacterium]|nr:HK97 family phage prohead protease [Porphyromonadaceae bacterium]